MGSHLDGRHSDVEAVSQFLRGEGQFLMRELEVARGFAFERRWLD
jgi:hypothetical protein